MGPVLLLTGFNGTSVTTDWLLAGSEWTSGPLTGAAAGFSVQSGPWLVPWWSSTSPQKCCSAAGMCSSVSWQNASFAKGSQSCDQHSNWFCIHGVICISTPHLDFDGQHWASEFIFSFSLPRSSPYLTLYVLKSWYTALLMHGSSFCLLRNSFSFFHSCTLGADHSGFWTEGTLWKLSWSISLYRFIV